MYKCVGTRACVCVCVCLNRDRVRASAVMRSWHVVNKVSPMCVWDGMLYSFTSNSLHIQFISQGMGGGGGREGQGEGKGERDSGRLIQEWQNWGGRKWKTGEGEQKEKGDGKPKLKCKWPVHYLKNIHIRIRSMSEYVNSWAESCLLFCIRDGRGEWNENSKAEERTMNMNITLVWLRSWSSYLQFWGSTFCVTWAHVAQKAPLTAIWRRIAGFFFFQSSEYSSFLDNLLSEGTCWFRKNTQVAYVYLSKTSFFNMRRQRAEGCGIA